MRTERSARPVGGAAAALPRFYSVPDAAALLGTSQMTLYRAIAAGEFPAVRIRGRLIVPARAIDELEESALAMTRPDDVDRVDGLPGRSFGTAFGGAR